MLSIFSPRKPYFLKPFESYLKDFEDLESSSWMITTNTTNNSISTHPANIVKGADGSYMIHMEVPGIPKEKILISIDKNLLTISGEFEDYSLKEGEAYSTQEYHRKDRFSRSWDFKRDIDETSVKACVKDGILTVVIPATETAKKKAIKTIKVE